MFGRLKLEMDRLQLSANYFMKLKIYKNNIIYTYTEPQLQLQRNFDLNINDEKIKIT